MHIPFCKSKCSYCSFYSVANNLTISDFIKALLKEIETEKYSIDNKTVKTIYFGGGTPSILKISEINNIIKQIKKHYKIAENAEITFEANPEDLTSDYLNELFKLGINRLSIGLQSTDEETLKMMRRRHTADQAISSVYNAFEKGFRNVSVDFIYGIKGISADNYLGQLRKIVSMPVKHISAYHLSIEKGTLLYRRLNERRLSIPDEDLSYDQYCKLIDLTSEAGFMQYEISNFAKTGFLSKHNSSYWSRNDYLGFGPSAHSLINNVRSSNPPDLKKYLVEIITDKITKQKEYLSETDILNETIMLELRTKNGLDLLKFKNLFGIFEYENLIERVKKLNHEFYKHSNSHLYLTKGGMFVSNSIISNLFK